MPTNTYTCPECGFKDEYIEGDHVAKENWHPEVCPKCNKGKLEKVFDMSNSQGGFDIVGYCYTNVYGKHNWKKGKSQGEIAKILAGEKDPY